ncbi:CGH_3_collapsed_G0000840.mRNA.1.CDS.1 [Saccharomyces cerevisiae]|nr:CGH_3_collapsed_G0000840.mRNA.1.CDS.1 [Saccharomyces cerevisiae]
MKVSIPPRRKTNRTCSTCQRRTKGWLLKKLTKLAVYSCNILYTSKERRFQEVFSPFGESWRRFMWLLDTRTGPIKGFAYVLLGY